MLRKEAVLDVQNICGNPGCRRTEAAQSATHDHEVSLATIVPASYFNVGGRPLPAAGCQIVCGEDDA